MKKNYEDLALEVISFDPEDVITSSTCPNDCGDVKDKCPEDGVNVKDVVEVLK